MSSRRHLHFDLSGKKGGLYLGHFAQLWVTCYKSVKPEYVLKNKFDECSQNIVHRRLLKELDYFCFEVKKNLRDKMGVQCNERAVHRYIRT